MTKSAKQKFDLVPNPHTMRSPQKIRKRTCRRNVHSDRANMKDPSAAMVVSPPITIHMTTSEFDRQFSKTNCGVSALQDDRLFDTH